MNLQLLNNQILSFTMIIFIVTNSKLLSMSYVLNHIDIRIHIEFVNH